MQVIVNRSLNQFADCGLAQEKEGRAAGRETRIETWGQVRVRSLSAVSSCGHICRVPAYPER